MALNTSAQTKKEQDRQSIKSMCGCYEVGFSFAETFNYVQDSLYKPSPVKHAQGLEWVQLVSDQDDKIIMQHLLIIDKQPKPHIIKHWRQDWLFENTFFHQYAADEKWKFEQRMKDEVKGQWTQRVFQIDDSPRYEGTASWVYVDGKRYWENTTDAPLPRREYTQRNDYNVLLRRNRHEITPDGWVHDQYNDKIIRTAGKPDVLLAQEKGYNTYVKVDDGRCKAAQDWWAVHQAMWQRVRTRWDEIFSRQKDLELFSEVDGKHLSEYLQELPPTADDISIARAIDAFVK